VEGCVKATPWSGTLTVEWHGVDMGGAWVEAAPVEGSPEACVSAAVAKDPVVRALEGPASAKVVVADDPRWTSAVTVTGAPDAARAEIQKRFGVCASGVDVDATFPITVEVVPMSGYDAPVGQMRAYDLAPWSEAGRQVASCASRDFLTSPGMKKGKTSAVVRVSTVVSSRPKVDIEAQPDVPAAARTAIADLVAGCAGITPYTGTFQLAVNVHGDARGMMTINATLPDALQQCLQESAPVGVPDGDFTVTATLP